MKERKKNEQRVNGAGVLEESDRAMVYTSNEGKFVEERGFLGPLSRSSVYRAAYPLMTPPPLVVSASLNDWMQCTIALQSYTTRHLCARLRMSRLTS